AATVFEQVRKAIADTPFSIDGESLQVTMSFGVSTFHPVEDNREGKALLAAADKALHAAKSNGRNCIVME
ncbi:MAG: diguanylate cyclase, partial [Chromatiales bacterium]|nr:diguanylate cyclase [Chromatiales bacterium]